MLYLPVDFQPASYCTVLRSIEPTVCEWYYPCICLYFVHSVQTHTTAQKSTNVKPSLNNSWKSFSSVVHSVVNTS